MWKIAVALLFVILSILDVNVNAVANEVCGQVDEATGEFFPFAPQVENPCNNTKYHEDHGLIGDIEMEREAVKNLHLAWKSAIDTRDLPAVVNLYDLGALVYATFKTTLSNTKEIEGYFRTLFFKDDLSVTFETFQTRIFASNTAITSGTYTFHYSSNGTMVGVPARYTFVYLRGVAGEAKNEWKIIDHHSSVDPEKHQVREQKRNEEGNAQMRKVQSTMKELWTLYNSEFI